MNRYWKCWKRGWWAFLFLLVVNTSAGLFLKILNSMLPKDGASYNLIMFGLFLFALIPFAGLAFEFFAGRSERLGMRVK
ncbi:hypothetical protein GGR67_000460 [Xanthomonas arboricola]|nr:hypothetical protein [Xanthomonas euroxanthea]